MTSDGEAYTVAQYSVLGSVSWELDLFGRIRSLKAKALNQFFATAQARSATQISLVAAVAENYLTLAADQEALRLALATLEAQKTSYEMIKRTREAGIASGPGASPVPEPGGKRSSGRLPVTPDSWPWTRTPSA